MKLHAVFVLFLLGLISFPAILVVEARGGHGKNGGPGWRSRNCQLGHREAWCVSEALKPMTDCIQPDIPCLQRVTGDDRITQNLSNAEVMRYVLLYAL